MRIIIDNNIWISFMIGKKLSMLKALFFRDDIEIYVCGELLREFCEVSKRSKIQKYISIQDIESTLVLIEERCLFVEIKNVADSNIRDAKDLYLLSLADTVSADYIVTGDKDLLVLIQHRFRESVVPLSNGGSPEGDKHKQFLFATWCSV